MLSDRIATFRENHPAANALCADIRTADIGLLNENSPRPVVVIVGPPCQGFSSIRPFRTLTGKAWQESGMDNFQKRLLFFTKN